MPAALQAIGPIGILAAGLLIGLAVGFSEQYEEPRSNPQTRRSNEFITEFLNVGPAGVVVGFLFGPALPALEDKHLAGLLALPWPVTWLELAPALWLCSLMIHAFNRLTNRATSPAPPVSSPAQSYERDRPGLIQLLGALLCGVPFGLAFGLMFGAGTGASTGFWLAFGLALGLLTVLAGTLTEVVKTAWFRFVAAALIQRLRRRLPGPRHMMTLLEDCYRLGLLRTVGPVYQFRHAELQDHLAPCRRS